MAEEKKTYIVRLYLEVRYDIPVEIDPQTGVTPEEAAVKALQNADLYGLVESSKGEYAENVHAVMVDTYTDGSRESFLASNDFNVDEMFEKVDTLSLCPVCCKILRKMTPEDAGDDRVIADFLICDRCGGEYHEGGLLGLKTKKE